ncbi:hypothetical protein G647_09022 [Cladophialophora carrionii CBS 160.54]|uniref:Heterokaryon incompatibility domain-containing protein n=1 Tax=Cladophialophora carrionii CBS 160.54 TaxID=1279043 RepID=V9D1Z3_9EURO|nr:uncharacterized protein G647_09022 [Cladophialophora carrionii CBS 160.54]ETI20007.1 hypothetical protein G647_09022 [Cladophialophora carrionii CBS 160.54]
MLLSYSSIRSRPSGLKAIDTGMIGILGADKYLIAQNQGSTWLRTLSPSHIDFEIIKDWLALCREMHKDGCASKASSLVPFMKLIDCETGDIVPAANYSYVALSYVCGEDMKAFGNCASIPKDLPATIEDSIAVTRKLGFRYLWVDQFCIDQKYKEDVTAQLLQMDSIYRNSDLTIIAAAGRDVTYGLPGVGKRYRSKHDHSRIKNQSLVSSLSQPQSWINDCWWTTRAWTYQEGILSRRRLVFTDEQVYYECYGMFCCEAFDLPLRDMHIRSQQRLKADFCAGGNIGIFPRGVGRGPWEVLQRIEEYSCKSLTNPQDILNAVLGILRAFEEGPFKIRHCLGVPFLPQSSGKLRRPPERSKTTSWKPVLGLLMGLCWRGTLPSPRRLGFPSWSWTGWTAPVKWDVATMAILQTDPNIDIHFELNDGRIIDYDSFQDSYNDLNRSLALSNYIHISAWTSTIELLGYTSHDDKYFTAKIDLEDGCYSQDGSRLSDGSYLHWVFKPTTTRVLTPDLTCIAIHMGYHCPGKRHRLGYGLMVVADFGSGMERVAFDWVKQSNRKIFEADGAQYRRLGVYPAEAIRAKFKKSWRQIRLR